MINLTTCNNPHYFSGCILPPKIENEARQTQNITQTQEINVRILARGRANYNEFGNVLWQERKALTGNIRRTHPCPSTSCAPVPVQVAQLRQLPPDPPPRPFPRRQRWRSWSAMRWICRQCCRLKSRHRKANQAHFNETAAFFTLLKKMNSAFSLYLVQTQDDDGKNKFINADSRDGS